MKAEDVPGIELLTERHFGKMLLKNGEEINYFLVKKEKDGVLSYTDKGIDVTEPKGHSLTKEQLEVIDMSREIDLGNESFITEFIDRGYIIKILYDDIEIIKK